MAGTKPRHVKTRAVYRPDYVYVPPVQHTAADVEQNGGPVFQCWCNVCKPVRILEAEVARDRENAAIQSQMVHALTRRLQSTEDQLDRLRLELELERDAWWGRGWHERLCWLVYGR